MQAYALDAWAVCAYGMHSLVAAEPRTVVGRFHGLQGNAPPTPNVACATQVTNLSVSVLNESQRLTDIALDYSRQIDAVMTNISTTMNTTATGLQSQINGLSSRVSGAFAVGAVNTGVCVWSDAVVLLYLMQIYLTTQVCWGRLQRLWHPGLRQRALHLVRQQDSRCCVRR